jgi:hypothetical protein
MRSLKCPRSFASPRRYDKQGSSPDPVNEPDTLT